MTGHAWGLAAVVALLAAVHLGSAAAFADEDRNVAELSGTDAGRDPHAFRTAEQMLLVAEVRSYDERAEATLQRIRARKTGDASQDMTSAADIADLVELDPCRRSDEVQAAVGAWAKQAAAWVRAHPDGAPASTDASDEAGVLRAARDREAASGASTPFDTANARYATGHFDEAAASYAVVLGAAPGHFDARNNLALSELHRGHDLIAQFHLETLCELDTGYLPAFVNLTVVYERLGRSDRARTAVASALAAQSRSPQAAFNAAWYSRLDGDFAKAAAQLQPFAESGPSDKYADLASLIDRQGRAAEETAYSTGQGALWTVGVAGRCGARESAFARIAAIVVFVVAGFVVALIAGAVGKSRWRNEGKVAGWIAFPCTAAVYVLAWGVPQGWAWVAAAAFVWIFTAWAVARSGA